MLLIHTLDHSGRAFATLRGGWMLVDSQLKDLLDDPHCLLGVLDSMANRPLILIDLPVVAARERLVAKEVDALVINA